MKNKSNKFLPAVREVWRIFKKLFFMFLEGMYLISVPVIAFLLKVFEKLKDITVVKRLFTALLMLFVSLSFVAYIPGYDNVEGTVLDPDRNFSHLNTSLYSYKYLDIRIKEILEMEYIVFEMENSSDSYFADFSIDGLAVNGCKVDRRLSYRLEPGEKISKKISISKLAEMGIKNVERVDAFICFVPQGKSRAKLTEDEASRQAEEARTNERVFKSVIFYENTQPGPAVPIKQVFSNNYITVWVETEPEYDPDDYPKDAAAPEPPHTLTIYYRNNCSYAGEFRLLNLKLNQKTLTTYMKLDDRICCPGDYGRIVIPTDGVYPLDFDVQEAITLSCQFRIVNPLLDSKKISNSIKTKDIFIVGSEELVPKTNNETQEVLPESEIVEEPESIYQ